MTATSKAIEWEYYLDFNDPTTDPMRRRRKSRSVPPHIRAAAAGLVKRQKIVVAFLQELDRADVLLYGDSSLKSEANKVALKAVIELLDRVGNDDARRLGRVFKLLADNLDGTGQDHREHNIKAATAFLVEYLASLPGQARRVKQLAIDAARVLTQRGFQFSGKNAAIAKEYKEEVDALKYGNPVNAPRPGVIKEWKRIVTARAKTIEMWRRGFKAGGGGRAGDLFRKYRNRKPFKVSDDAGANAQAATAWWYETLSENDY